jgi:hypothetical protein
MPAMCLNGRSSGCRHDRVYTPVTIRRVRSLRKALTVLVLLSLASCPALLFGQTAILTYHANMNRTGLYNTETLLNQSNVNSVLFGKLFSYPVDGFVVGQPLYVPNVSIAGSIHNAVYVATQNNSVYAIDADSGSVLWSVNEGQAETILEEGCQSTGYSEIGIMGTPVISGSTGTIYFVSKTVSGSAYSFWVHAVDITTGLDKFGSPVEVSASFIAPNGTSLNFQTEAQILMQRPALLLENDVLYIAFGSNGCDLGVQGWLFAYDSGIASGTLQQLAYANTAPDQSYGASIWMSGNGPAGDGLGNAFFSTANGTFDFSTGGPDLGDSILKASYSAGSLNLPTLSTQTSNYFTPFDQLTMAQNDLDLGSSGTVVLTGLPGQNPNLLVTSGKEGGIYLLNPYNLSGYNATNEIVQYLPEHTLGAFYSTPVYWNYSLGSSTIYNLYFAGNADYIKAFNLTLSNAQPLSTSPAVSSNNTTSGGVPIISASGTISTSGVLWIVTSPAKPILQALNAVSMTALYNSNQVGTRDGLGATAHFATPMVANGRVYVGTQTQLVAYGLFPVLTPTGGKGQSGTVGTTLPQTISVQALSSLRVPVTGLAVTFSDGGVGGTFSNPNATTDSTGTASTTYTLPTKAQTVFITAGTTTAQAPPYTSASFVETAVPGPPTSIGLVSGGGQSGTVGTQLPASIVVQLQDTYHNGVPGLNVHFNDNGAGGTFTPNPATTGSNGDASASYTLPTVAKLLSLTATYSTLRVNFGETSVAASPATLKIVSGNNQTAAPNTQLPKPLVVLVSDQYNNPVSGVSVTYSDNGAGGKFSPSNSVTTNARGQASVNYTTGSKSGAITITGSVSGLSSVTFHATVQ